jgi:plasmid stabilization system protein ParE
VRVSGSIVVAPLARAQIREALIFTRNRFGVGKAREYALLIRMALTELAKNPAAGKKHPEIHPDAWIYPIGKPGKNARHLFLYRVRENTEVARFLYDAMDLPRQWPDEWRDGKG